LLLREKFPGLLPFDESDDESDYQKVQSEVQVRDLARCCKQFSVVNNTKLWQTPLTLKQKFPGLIELDEDSYERKAVEQRMATDEV
jgi:hypothetical protein